MTDKYAYGDWEFNGEKCPISSAGFGDYYVATEVGEEYDDILRQVILNSEGASPSPKGIVTEDVAKKAWDKLINVLEGYTEPDSGSGQHTDDMLALAQKVKQKEFNNGD